MEKTPRRSAPPAGSVVVDPTSQTPQSGVPLPTRGSRGAGATTRRKPEATLVLEARRVDSLRRQVVERQRAQKKGRRRQIVLWGLAGAGAVLFGGWLATSLSPRAKVSEEAPLVLGRTDEEPGVAAPEPPIHEGDGHQLAASARPPGSERRGLQHVQATPPPGVDGGQRPDPAVADPGPAAAASEPTDAAERAPDQPKTVGDWGDGFDTSGGSSRRGDTTRSHVAGPQAPSGSDAVDLDELPTE